MKKLFRLSLSLLVCWMSSSLAWADGEEYVPEPLLMRSEALGQLFRASPYGQRFRLGETGASRLHLSRGIANFWGHDKRYIVDAETRDDVLRVHYQFGSVWEAYGGLSERAFTRSGTDGVAMGFHTIFGLPQDGRIEAPKHATRVSVPDFNLNYTSDQSQTTLSRQIELGAVWDLNKTFDLGLATTLAVFAFHESAAHNPYFSDTVNGGFRLSSAKSFGNVAFFGSVSLAVFDQKQEVQIATYEQQWGLITGASYRFFERHELVSQLLVYQPIFQSMGQLSRESYEIHAAYRYTLDKVSIELGLVENIFWVYNSPDWGMSVGLSYHFAK